MKKHLLIVDDQISIRKLLAFVLGEQYQITTFSDGMEAMRWLQEGNLPHAVIADIDMPHLDGKSFLKQIRSSGFFKGLPVLMLSGLDSSADRIECLQAGADDYLVKPFNPKELSLKLDILLSRRQVA